MPFKDPEQRRAARREYGKRAYARHRERELARSRAWALAHPEQKRAHRRKSDTKHAAGVAARQAEYWRNGGKQKHRAYRERFLADPVVRMRYLLASAKRRAAASGVCFDDSLSVTLRSVPRACACCGTPFTFSSTLAMRNSSPSLDRFDNAKGYVPGNVRVVCFACNRLKSDGTLGDFTLLAAYATRVPHPARLAVAASR